MSVSNNDILTSLERGIFSEIEFEINHNCNRACGYCPNLKYERMEKGEMAPELFEKIMIQLREIGFKGRVSYHFYNEPLLCNNLDKFIRMTGEYLPDSVSYLYSNGTLLTKKRFVQLTQAGLDKFHITKHENVGENYVFEKVYNGLPQELKKLVFYEDFKDVEYSNRGGLLPDIKNEWPENLPCFIPLRLVTVTLKGNVLPCYEDFFQVLSMGNVNDEHILDIWNSDKYREFRENLRQKGNRNKYDICRNCNNFKIT